jgi:citrate lyase alpha subunit
MFGYHIFPTRQKTKEVLEMAYNDKIEVGDTVMLKNYATNTRDLIGKVTWINEYSGFSIAIVRWNDGSVLDKINVRKLIRRY